MALQPLLKHREEPAFLFYFPLSVYKIASDLIS